VFVTPIRSSCKGCCFEYLSSNDNSFENISVKKKVMFVFYVR
jgi:hypothetical protein